MGTGTVIKARDVNYAVSTGAGATIAINGITLATEAVVTTAEPHGITDATAVLFDGIVGMTELNGLTLPVDVLTTTTFKIVKYNTLNAASYVSGGTIAPLTFTNACELNNYSWTSGSTPETDDSTWCDDVAKIGFGKPVLLNPKK